MICHYCKQTIEHTADWVALAGDGNGRVIGGYESSAEERLDFCDLDCVEAYFQTLDGELDCIECKHTFPIKELTVDCDNPVCGGCKQERDRSFLCFLDRTNASPRKSAINEVFAATFLIECGWKVEMPSEPRLQEAISKWKEWREKHPGRRWEAIGADYIHGIELLKEETPP